MTIWFETIALNPLISKYDKEYDLSREEELCPQEILDALADEVEKSSVLKSNFCGVKIRKCKTIAELNRKLNKVFDIADRHKVWCGF